MERLRQFIDILVHALKEFIDIVDTPGGHIMLALVMVLIGATLAIRGHLDVAREFLSFTAIMAYAMRGRDKANGKGDPQLPTNEKKEG